MICPKCGMPTTCLIKGREFKIPCDCDKRAEKEAELALKAEAIKARQRSSGIGERYLGARFNESFSPIYKPCMAYCKNAKTFLNDGVGIYIYGKNGVGKTYLTSCMANDLIESGYYVKWVTMQSVLAEIQKSYKEKNALSEAEAVASLTAVDFLFIDDLGKEFIGVKSPFAEKVLFEIVNARYNAKKPTIYSSNFSIKDLSSKFGVDKAICDRIGEMSAKVLLFEGDDQRPKNYSDRKKFLEILGI